MSIYLLHFYTFVFGQIDWSTTYCEWAARNIDAMCLWLLAWSLLGKYLSIIAEPFGMIFLSSEISWWVFFACLFVHFWHTLSLNRCCELQTPLFFYCVFEVSLIPLLDSASVGGWRKSFMVISQGFTKFPSNYPHTIPAIPLRPPSPKSLSSLPPIHNMS